MKRFLEKIIHTVVPHEKNRNVPHLLRKEFIVLLSIFVIALFYFNQNNFNIIRGLNLTATVYPAVLADLTNQDRILAGVPELSWSGTLEQAARLKAEDMIKNGYFAHTSPAGLTPWYWLTQTNYNFIYAGENLAIDFTESANVESAWLNSPKHKENVLNLRFTEIGIMALDGPYQGRNTTFVVEFFGKPAFSQVAEASTVAEVPETKPKTDTTKPKIAGVSAETTKSEPPVKIIEETEKPAEKFISAQNMDAVEAPAEENSNLSEGKPISAWYMRFIVSPTSTIKIIYSIILGFILVAMALMLSKEYQKHHTKHLIMGSMLVALIGVFMYFINYSVSA